MFAVLKIVCIFTLSINQKQKTMTTFRKTIETYKKGYKSMAFLAFKNDPTSIDGVTFEEFCKFMDKTMGNIHTVCPITGKLERA